MISPLPTLLATINVESTLTLWQNLNYQLVGVAIVLFSLGFLALAVFVVGKIIHSSVQAAQKTVLVPPPAVEPMPSLTAAKKDESPTEEEGISRELRAVIAAAVYVSLKGAHRIIEINPVSSAQTQAWSMEGRRQIFQSHRVR